MAAADAVGARSEMRRIIEYFDRSYIINLSDRTDRRRQAEQEFRRVGTEIPNEKVRFYTATRPSEKGGFDSVGTRGCFTSHRNVLGLANRDSLRNVLVFEDDVSFRSVGDAFEEQLLAQLTREDWDLVFFAYASPPDHALKGPLTRWSNDIRGTHFYGVNGAFIRTMLLFMNECESRPQKHPAGGPMPADGAYNHVRYIIPDTKLLLSVPSLAYQRSSRTDVAPTKFVDRIFWVRPILDRSRVLKHQLRMVLDRNRLRRQLGKR
jgi:hypothetical protein